MAEGGSTKVKEDLSRMQAAYGAKMVGKLKKLSMLVVGLDGLGIETVKNLLLTGPGTLAVHDDTIVSHADLGVNFYLKAEDVDRNIPITEVRHYALATGIKLRRDDDELMALVQLVVDQEPAEALPEVFIQTTAGAKALVNRTDFFVTQTLHPHGVVQCLGNHFTGGAVSLEFDQHQCAIRSDGKQIDPTAHASTFLPPNQHPLIR